MAYRTLAWVMALICGLAIPAGAATLTDGFSDQPIFQSDACEKLVNAMAKTPGVIARNITQESGIPAATTAPSQAGSIIAVDNAILVSVHGNAMVDNGMRNEKTYKKPPLPL
jgi:hypothetical protein